MFLNRAEAGNLLANELTDYINNDDVVIMAIPRGGVPIGYTISKKLHLPLEIVLSKKIGHPYNKEYAIGAVTLKSKILSDAAYEVSDVYIEEETKRIRKLLKKRQTLYYGDKKPMKLKNKRVILVDDGVATGNTVISCIHLIEKLDPDKIIIALPVAPPSAIKSIKEISDIENVICLHEPRNFSAVGQFYQYFDQVNDQEVIQLLKDANKNLSLDLVC